MASPWQEEVNTLKEGHFSDEEIAGYQQDRSNELFKANFTQSEIDNYFGVKKFDTSGLKDHFQKNADEIKKQDAPAEGAPPDAAAKVRSFGEYFSSLWDALDEGWQHSITSLLRHAPDPTHAPIDPDMFQRLAKNVGMLAGDVPEMFAGYIGGGLVGGALGLETGPGAAVTAGIGGSAGAMALPAGMRTWLMQSYEKGEAHDFKSFWEKAAPAALDALKAGTVGAVAGGTSNLISPVFGKLAVPGVGETGQALLRNSGTLATEVAAMTVIGSALEGQAPKASDFLDNAILVGGIHAAKSTPGAFRSIYEKLGIHPRDQAEIYRDNPAAMQEVNSEKPDLEKLRQYALETLPKASTVDPKKENPSTTKEEEPKYSSEKLVEKNPEAFSEDEKAAAPMFGEPKEGDRKVPWGYEFRYKVVDNVNSWVKFMNDRVPGLKIPALQDPVELYRRARNAPARAQRFLEDSTIDVHGNVNGKGLLPILKEHGILDKKGYENPEKRLRLEIYMGSKRALEYEKQGIEHGFDVERSQRIVDAGHAEFDQAAKDITAYRNRVLEFAKDRGLISQEQHDSYLRFNEDYVDFVRLSDELGDGRVDAKGNRLGKARIGSDKAIQRPLLSVFEATDRIISAAEENHAKAELVYWDRDSPGQRMLKEVTGAGAPAKNQFEFIDKGVRTVVEPEDPYVADTANALSGNKPAQDLFFRFARSITQNLKRAITLDPAFIGKNSWRDASHRAGMSEVGSGFYEHFIDALGEVSGKTKTFWDAEVGGTFANLNESYLEKNIFKLQKQTGFFNSVANVIQHPWETAKMGMEVISEYGERVEKGTRVAEYMKTLEVGGADNPFFRAEGVKGARRVTVDFDQHGASELIAKMSAVTAFMNPAIQGLDRAWQAFSDPKTAARTGLNCTAFIAIPSMYLWFINHEQDWYKEIPQWQKDLFWHVRAGGIVFRLPKPQELGLLFGTLPERLLETLSEDNPRAFRNFKETVLQTLPNFTPDIVTPVLEQWSNKSTFTGRPLIPWSMEKVNSAYQYTDYTSQFSQTLGGMLNKLPKWIDDSGTNDPASKMFSTGVNFINDVGPDNQKLTSPMVIDNFIRAWGGTWGQTILKMTDLALSKAGVVPDTKASMTLSDIPFVKAFVTRQASGQNESIQIFREMYSEREKNYETLKLLEKSTDPYLAASYANEVLGKTELLKNIKQDLSDMGKEIRMINDLPLDGPYGMSKDDKRDKIDKIYFQMSLISRQGIKTMDEVAKWVKQNKSKVQ